MPNQESRIIPKPRAQRLSLGFSPCPNDCFIFDALVHGKVDTEGLQFEPVMADVEELNRRAFLKNIDITKLSYHAFAHLTNDYLLLDSGSALGFGVGPLLVSGSKYQVASDMKVAIPGKYTTANFLFSLCFPNVKNKAEMLFSDIEGAVLSGEVDAGVIIHENRFTYEQKGLHKILDLGEWWEKETGAAIPLGGIVMKRSLPDELKRKVDRVIRRSLEYAFENPGSSAAFVKEHAQEMEEAVRKKHIELYVNKYSLDLGPEGRKAVITLFEKAKNAGIIKEYNKELFLQS